MFHQVFLGVRLMHAGYDLGGSRQGNQADNESNGTWQKKMSGVVLK